MVLHTQSHGTGCSAAEKGLTGVQGVELLTQALGRAKEVFPDMFNSYFKVMLQSRD